MSNNDEQDQTTQALSQAQSMDVLNNEIQLNAAFINGSWQHVDESENTQVQSLYNPSSGEVIATTKLSSLKQVDEAAQAAKKAFTSWSQTSVAKRAEYLAAIADSMEAEFDKLVGLSVLNNGKPIEEANIDVSDAIACYRFYSKLIKDQPARVSIETQETGVKLYKSLEPIGVCALIVPWNFPMVTTAWKLAPALAAGCTVLLKPSEVTLIPELYLGNILKQVGLPAGVVNIIPGAAEVGSALTHHPLVDKVSFTGSNTVGEKVMQQAASGVKDISLELGGKSPIVVCHDADIDTACELIMGGIFFNAGQICSATSRLLVHEDIAERLYSTLKQKTEALTVGNGYDATTMMGPVVSQQQYDQVQRYFDIANEEGLECLTGGHIIDRKGYYLEPTIYINVPTDSRLWREEVFGPVLVTHTFKDNEEAIQLANDSTYALVATVVSADDANAMQLAAQIPAGHIWINELQIVLPESGWGGFKQSGIGRELGTDGLAAYQKSKHYVMPNA